ncbi:MAG: prepilin-type N-terminal cleavage/methylation domain-containing protein [Syntrophomonadaceae bacterium]|nr:prepilin-type N-terminal cleavage/methylation domain-containing protein [Syntrophomonadaceae bacterium]
MFLKNFFIKNEQGLTLIEVIVALVILALIAMNILSFFSTSGIWIMGAGQKTQVSSYAAAIMEGVRAHSAELTALDFSSQPVYTFEDSDITDNDFSFLLGKKIVSVHAPAHMKATLNISPHDDTQYYHGDSNNNGIPEVNGKEIYFPHNLFHVNVTITGDEKIDSPFTIDTVIGAR